MLGQYCYEPHLTINLKMELKQISTADIITKQQKELFREQWHYLSADRLAQTHESFHIEWWERSENVDVGWSINCWDRFIKNLKVTLMKRGKRQILTNSKIIYIFKRFIKKEINIKQLCFE